ncbi:hypothetical protein D3C72_2131150 [compost metagenome]
MHRQCLTLHPAGGHRSCVTADTFCAFTFFIGLVRNVDEFGAQRLNLLLHRRTHVRGFDHCTEALGRRDGLQPGHTGTENQHSRSFDGACGGHQHRHEARIVMSSQ